jgi:hypothetical protein
MAEKKKEPELQPGQRLADGELRSRGIDPQDPERAHSREELGKVPISRQEAREVAKELKEDPRG